MRNMPESKMIPIQTGARFLLNIAFILSVVGGAQEDTKRVVSLLKRILLCQLNSLLNTQATPLATMMQSSSFPDP
jgi:hypothetical protein